MNKHILNRLQDKSKVKNNYQLIYLIYTHTYIYTHIYINYKKVHLFLKNLNLFIFTRRFPFNILITNFILYNYLTQK